jgi:hypothetical protein
MDLFADEAAQLDRADRRDEIEQHREHWLLAWRWHGPQIGEPAEVGMPIVWSETHQNMRYHAQAPIRIVEQLDAETYRAVVEYAPTAPPHCLAYNGEILRLDILEIAPPTRRLRNPTE